MHSYGNCLVRINTSIFKVKFCNYQTYQTVTFTELHCRGLSLCMILKPKN